MVQEQAEQALIDLAVEEAKGGGGTLKELKDVTAELEGMLPTGEAKMSLMSTADKIRVWNRHTGRQGFILSDALRFQLGKRFPKNHPMAGERVYSLKPVEKPAGLKLKCWLHPKNEIRPWLDSIGLTEKTCQADTIPTEYAVKVHMMKRHGKAYSMIMDERGREERRKEMEIRQRQLEALERMSSQPASDQPKVFHCEHEGCSRFFDSKQGRKLHTAKEHKK